MPAVLTVPPRRRYDVHNNVRLSSDQVQHLEAIAVAHGSTRAEIVRQAIDRLIAELNA